MAVATVTADNDRVDDAEAITGVSSIGGGAGAAAEAPFAYQGSNLWNRKITSATGAGFYYDPTADSGTARDMTTTDRKTWMVKIMVSDYNGLDATDGVLIRIGSGTAAYYAFILAGTDSPAAFADAYRDVGGMLVIPVDPNEFAAYNDTVKDAGSPVLTAVDYFGAVWAFSSSSAKNENCGLDAIDIGSGLYLVGGDGVSADATFQDFVDFDGGTVGNRYGYARNGDGGVILAYGNWRIGENSGGAVATELTDSSSIVFWLDHLAAAGFSVATANLGHASSIINDGATHIGAGDITNVDSRPDYLVTGTVATAPGTFSHNLRNFRNVTYNSISQVQNADISCQLLTQDSAHIRDTLIRTTSITSVACLQDPTFGASDDLHDVEFRQEGAGHAVEMATVGGTYTLTNMLFTDYGADTTDSAALDVTAATGTTTINLTNTPQPTYKSAGATVVFVATYTLTLTGIPTGVQVTIVNSSTRAELQNSTSTGVDVTYTHSGGETVDVLFMANAYDPNSSDIYDLTLPSSDSSIPISLSDDLNYNNP